MMPNNGVLNNGVLSAIAGGIVGSIMIIALQKICEWLERPRLSIEFEQKEPFCREATIQGSGTQSYWIRIKVKNEGRTVAKRCVGKLMEIRKIENGNEEILTSFDPSALRWVAFKDIERLAIDGKKNGKKYSDKQYNGWFKKIGTLDINRAEYEYLNVVYTIEKMGALGELHRPGPDPFFHVSVTDPEPRGIETKYRKGTYILKITIYSENADPESREFCLEWNSIWNEIKMRKKSKWDKIKMGLNKIKYSLTGVWNKIK